MLLAPYHLPGEFLRGCLWSQGMLASVTVAAPFACACFITLWRRCSNPLVQVAPDAAKQDAKLFMPKEAKVDAGGVDVLDMTVLQPIAPAGGVMVGSHAARGGHGEEHILAVSTAKPPKMSRK